MTRLRVYTGWVYTDGIDQREGLMTTTAKLFKNGRSQAVRLPREFRFEGDRVRVRRVGRGVLVEPVFTEVAAWFAEMDRLASEPFMPEGRQQPPVPKRDVFG
jgi:antitoxin VapB